jgi:DNA-directed RNA polymerase specialized sigma24 family protein
MDEKKKRKRLKKDHELYISKKEMMDELIKYNDSKVISEELGEMFLKIAKRYTSKPNFSGYSYRKDMISEAVYRMCDQVDKFDINHPSANPFAYFTQVAHNQILLLLNKEKKHRIAKENYRQKIWEDLCHDEHLNNINPHDNKEDS